MYCVTTTVCCNGYLYVCCLQISYTIYGHVRDVDLVPNGYAISVTNHVSARQLEELDSQSNQLFLLQNRNEFVDLYIHHLLEESVAPQFEVMPSSAVVGFSSCEFDVLLLLYCSRLLVG